MNELLRHELATVGEKANRLHGIAWSAPVRVRIGELRDAAAALDLALGNADDLGNVAGCNILNRVNQLGVFCNNCGTGMEQGEQHSFYKEAEDIVVSHLGRWVAYFNELASALEAGQADEWLAENRPPPGQPGQPE
jgi:hypothetical protein